MVIAIITILSGLLLPALSKAKVTAKSAASLNNLRQLGLGVQLYRMDSEDYFSLHSSLKSLTTAQGKPRTRWADYIYPYMGNEKLIGICFSSIVREWAFRGVESMKQALTPFIKSQVRICPPKSLKNRIAPFCSTAYPIRVPGW